MSEKPKGVATTFVVIALIVGLAVGAGLVYALIPPAPGEVITETATITKAETSVVTETTEVTVSEKKGYEDYHIIEIIGDEADPFCIPIVTGAKEAEKNFGCKVDIFYSKGWSPEEFLKNLRTAIALRPDAIVYMPFGPPEAVAHEIEEAFNAGIIVYFQGMDIPEIRQKYVEMGFVGMDVYRCGEQLALAALTKYGFGPGDRAAVFSGAWGEPVRALRAVAIFDTLTEAGMTVDKVDHPAEVYGDPGKGLEYVAGYVAAHPDVKLIAFDGGGTTSAVDMYIEGIGKEPGEIKCVGFDLTPGAIRSIRAGCLQITLETQPFLYGYLTVVNLLLTKRLAITGLFVDTSGGIVDETNVELVAELAEQGYR